MKIYLSIVLFFFVGVVVNANSGNPITVTQQSVKAQKTVALDWSTFKCVQYGGAKKTYLIKGLNGVLYTLKNKNWDCEKNAAVYKYDVARCQCKQLYPPSSGGGNDDDDKGSCVIGGRGCGGSTTGETTGASTGGVTGETTGATDGGSDDGGADTGATTGETSGGADTGFTTGEVTGGGDTGAVTGETTGGGDTGVTTGETTGGADTGFTTGGEVDAGGIDGRVIEQ